MTNLSDIIKGIDAGDFDADLSYLTEYIRGRRDYLAQQQASELAPGDTVRLDDIRPKYLIGATATVVRVRQKKVVCTLDHPNGKFPPGAEVAIPLVCVSKVS